MEMLDEREHSSMEELITSFQLKINKMRERSKIPYIPPTIVSRSITLTESVQRHHKPRRVSIGPFHRRDVNFQIMEDFKWSFLYISNFGSFSFEELSVCFLGLKKLEEQCRSSYSVIVDMKSDEFVEMLFLDACFIVLLALVELEKNHITRQSRQPVEESSLSTAQANLLSETQIREILMRFELLNVHELDRDVTKDMYILENQIPFFILEYMWNWFLETLNVESPLDFLECQCIINYVPSERRFPKKIHHLLHFFHCRLLPPPSEACESFDRCHRPWIPSVKELKDSGIDFLLETSNDLLRMDITFKDGGLHIPETFLEEEFRAMLANLVDFEQSVHGEHSTSVSNYVFIMACLLSKEEDVKILRSQSSFRYAMGWDKDVQRFFHDLEQRCSYWKVENDITTLFEQLNRFHSSRFNTWKAIFRRKFCNNPWIALSVLGGIILFILTFLQTFFAMYSYFRPPI